MRILVLTDLYPPVAFGGYELECAALVDGLRPRHELRVLTTSHQRGEAPADPIVVRELPFVGRGPRAAAAAPLSTLSAVRTVERELAQFRPELLYASSAAAMPQAALAAVARSGLPLVLRLSELWFAQNVLTGDRFLRHLEPGEGGVRGAWARAVRGVNRHPSLRLTPPLRGPLRAALSWNSEALRELAGRPPAVDPVLERVIHPASPHADALAAAERAPAPEPLVAYLGRVTTYKGAEVALEAVAQLRERHGTSARLVYGGVCDAPMEAALRASAAARGVEVELRGRLDVAGVMELLREAHAVIVPSVRPEAFGLSAVEAALARAPVVASMSGGIPEALREGTDALFFPPGDAAGAADALARTLGDREATAARVRSAFERARGFSAERYVTASEQLIEDTLAACSSAARP